MLREAVKIAKAAAGRFGAAQAKDPQAHDEEEGAEDGGQNKICGAVFGWKSIELDLDGLGLIAGLQDADRDGLAGEEAAQDRSGHRRRCEHGTPLMETNRSPKRTPWLYRNQVLLSPVGAAPLNTLVCSNKAPMKGVFSQELAKKSGGYKGDEGDHLVDGGGDLKDAAAERVGALGAEGIGQVRVRYISRLNHLKRFSAVGHKGTTDEFL